MTSVPQRFVSRVARLLYLTIASAAITAACSTFGRLGVTGDEDDRPPIIVSSGSIVIGEGDGAKHGGFEKHGFLVKQWHHLHPNAGPLFFSVTIEGSSTCTAATAYETTELDFEVVIDGHRRSFGIDIKERDNERELRVKGQTGAFAPDGSVPYRLRSKDVNARLSAVTIVGPDVTCLLDGAKPSVTIAQPNSARR